MQAFHTQGPFRANAVGETEGLTPLKRAMMEMVSATTQDGQSRKTKLHYEGLSERIEQFRERFDRRSAKKLEMAREEAAKTAAKSEAIAHLAPPHKPNVQPAAAVPKHPVITRGAAILRRLRLMR